MAERERLSRLSPHRYWVAVALAGALFLSAYANGMYGLSTQATAAVLVWWTILVATLLGVVRWEDSSRAAIWVGSALGCFALWGLTSALWSASAEGSVAEFDRVVLYLGVFLLVTAIARPGSVDIWADGLAIAISGTSFVALASRFFPSLFSQHGLPTFLPASETRLSFPLGYWNGLAIFSALAVPLLLRATLAARSPVVRGIALAPIPAIAAVVYLASSRGGVATLLVGAVVLLVASDRRAALLASMCVAAGGAALALSVLLSRRPLIDGPLGTSVARSDGRSAALLISLICVATAAAYAVGARFWPSRLTPSATTGRVFAFAAGLLAVGALFAAHPVRRFDAFKQYPQAYQSSTAGGFVRAHLFSGNGSGRWQFWTLAVDEWRTRPLGGRGAGSFEAWWAAHGSLATFVKDAHSLYLQTLAEMGLIGLALLLAALVGGIVAGVSRLRRSPGDERVTTASVLAAFIAYVFAAGIDWVWELPAVTLVGVACLGLLVLPAHGAPVRPTVRTKRRGRHVRVLLPSVVLIATVLALLSEGDQLIGQAKIKASQAATSHRELRTAFADAVDARDLQPWAATPYLQIALVAEQQQRLATASQAIADATARAPDDWRLWLVRSRIEAKRGRIGPALKALRRAEALNPRSPLFAGAG
jgi:O-antigen ligase